MQKLSPLKQRKDGLKLEQRIIRVQIYYYTQTNLSYIMCFRHAETKSYSSFRLTFLFLGFWPHFCRNSRPFLRVLLWGALLLIKTIQSIFPKNHPIIRNPCLMIIQAIVIATSNLRVIKTQLSKDLHNKYIWERKNWTLVVPGVAFPFHYWLNRECLVFVVSKSCRNSSVYWSSIKIRPIHILHQGLEKTYKCGKRW